MKDDRVAVWMPQQVMEDVGKGIGAGLVATIPMSVVMVLLHQILPTAQALPLPPKQITAKSGRAAGAEMDKQELHAATVVVHLGYGAGVGGLYGLLARYLPLPPVVGGVLYGLLVWSGSYMGWVPALGLMEPATEQPKGRNIMMVAAHLVWGAVTGGVMG